MRIYRAVAGRLQGFVPQGGFTTAELLGNAALGIAILAGIWLAIQGLGDDIIEFIRGKLQL